MLLAAVLAFSVLLPTLDTFICLDEPAVTASASGTVRSPPTHEDGGDALCVHGHCHHWVGVARVAERLNFTLAESTAGAFYALYGPPPAAPPHELLRPPRA